MSVALTYQCSGCENKATVNARAERRVVSARAVVVGGVAFDRTVTEVPTIESAAPDGWMVFDPYTLMTYCPECWISIENREPQQAAAR